MRNMAKDKESIAISKSLYAFMNKEAHDRDIYIYKLAQEAWDAYLELRGRLGPEPPPDPHAEIIAAVRKILNANGEQASALRVVVKSMRKGR